MFEDIRRDISRIREKRRKKELLRIEKERRLAYIKTRKVEQMSAERERSLSTRLKALGTLEQQRLREKEAKLSLRKLQREERQRRLRPYVAVSRAMLAPIKFVAKSVTKGAKPTAKSLILGDTDILLGKPSGKPGDIHDLIFGKTQPSSKDILGKKTRPSSTEVTNEDITRDILGGGDFL